MKMTQEIATYDLQNYSISYGGDSDLLVREASGNQEVRYDLKVDPLFLRVTGNGDTYVLHLGKGLIENDHEYFRRILDSGRGPDAFRVIDNQGIGIADERDVLKASYFYAIDQAVIALLCKGETLEVTCPGDPMKELPWYKEKVFDPV